MNPQLIPIGKDTEYHYLYFLNGDKVVVIFYQSFVPKDDGIITDLISKLIATYYKDKFKSISLEKKDNIGYLKAECESANYIINITKEESGEINSLIFEKESK